MENDKIETLEPQQVSTFDKFKKIIKSIQENAGALTFLTTTAVVVGGAILRLIAYLIEYGKTKHFGISSSLIDVTGDNVLYDLFVKGVFALLFILLNLILFSLWSGESKPWIKVGGSLLFVLFPDLILIIYLVVNNLRGIKYSILEIGIFLVVGLLLGVVLFFWGIYNGICKYRFEIKQKENSKEEIKKETIKKTIKKSTKKSKKESHLKVFKICLFIFAFLLVIESLLFIVAGYNIAYSQNHFKIINSYDNTYYAVIYENPNRYVITECEIEGDYISFPHLDTQQEIDRDEVKYQWQTLTQRR